MSTYPIRGIFGLEPNKISTNLIRCSRGYLIGGVGDYLLEFTSNSNDITLTNNGLWGLDTGSISNGELYIYALRNNSNAYGLIASKEKFEADVTCPNGYSVVRKLPWGVIYNTARGGVPSFHLAHWPSPFVTLTDAESTTAYGALSDGSATAWTDVDLSAWLPDNARVAYLSVVVKRKNANSAGSCFIRSSSAQTVGILAGSIGSDNSFSNNTQFIRASSARKIQYKNNSTNARTYIYVLGYLMTEQS